MGCTSVTAVSAVILMGSVYCRKRIRNREMLVQCRMEVRLSSAQPLTRLLGVSATGPAVLSPESLPSCQPGTAWCALTQKCA